MLDKIIYYAFATLFALTPLFWSSLTFELFEFNKMILVYGLTVVITGAWALKSIKNKRLTINRTPLDIPLLLFLGANILSTIFSIDHHTSIWGYYSRSNGGLLSIISYLSAYFAFVSNVSKEQVLKLLKIGLVAGFIISVWGILEHFGVSISCVILRQELNASCWVQDVQSRVFATLGQPNWMASYLGMLIFPAMYFLVTSTVKVTMHKLSLVTCYLLLVTFYLAFTFTYSRGASLGLLAGLLVFIFLSFPLLRGSNKIIKPFLAVLASFLLINLLFGSALTRFQFSQLLPKSTSELNPDTSEVSSSVTQLESGGTESGQIRLIVWQGALNIFRHYPVLGSGVETFAYSYYQYRPVAANQTSEWDFLYNKAHNEFLNYLANTGIVGFGTYLLMTGTFLFWSIKRIMYGKNNSVLRTLHFALVASYISYLITNFFGFSVVITAVLFFLFPAMAFVHTNSLTTLRLSPSIIFRHTKIAKFFLLLSTFYLLFSIFKLWYADTIFTMGQRASEAGNLGKAYDYLSSAVSLHGGEPLFSSERSNAAAASALALKEIDATLSANLKDSAKDETDEVLAKNPYNISFIRTAIRTYYDLSQLDSSLNDKLLNLFDVAIKLAPTDPKLLYNKAVVLGTLDRNKEALTILNKAIELKPNYPDAYFASGLILFDEKRYEEAVTAMRNVLKIAPNDADAINKLNDWGNTGIATKSANP